MEMQPLSGVSCSLGAAGLAEGTNANTFQIANAVPFVIKGRSYLKAATDNIAFSAGHTALAASQTCIFAVCINAAGTVSTVQSEIVANADLGVTKAIQCPDIPDNLACLGHIQVSTNASGAFTPASTDLGAANVFDAYVNYALGIPPRLVDDVLTA